MLILPIEIIFLQEYVFFDYRATAIQIMQGIMKRHSTYLIRMIAWMGVLLLVSFLQTDVQAQRRTLPLKITNATQLQQALQSGRLSEEDLKKAIEEGRVSPEAVDLYRKQSAGGMGKLTPEEIEAGKRLIEKEKEKPSAERPADTPPEKRDEAKKEVQPADAEKEPSEEKIKAEEKEGVEKQKLTRKEELKEMVTPEDLEIFGHNLFDETPSTFAPIQAVPVSNDYIIGPGDEIIVNMWGRLDESYSLEVNNEGVLNFPKIGPLTVAGLTFGELKELIRHKAEAITGVNVNVSMGKLKTLQVFILGEVKNPGIYTVSSLSTVMNALFSAGGPTELGSLRTVQLKRQGEIVAVMDLYDLLLSGDTSRDTSLMSGDVIFVPQAGSMVSIMGNVKREAIYELKNIKTLEYALNLAGGLAPSAYKQRIQIERVSRNTDKIVMDISFDQLQQDAPIPLQDGDLVRVFTILPDAINAVYLYGNVRRPGRYAYKSDLRIGDVIENLDELEKDTYLDYALIKRYRYEDSRAELIPFDLGRLLIAKDGSQNLRLMPRDEIYIFNQEMFQDEAYAMVEGQVRKPDRYLIDDMTIRDLILKAGDLAPDAYLSRGELIRIDKDRNRHTIYFDVAAVMNNEPAHNIRVQNEDILVIHSVLDEQWEEVVTIQGEVKASGEYLLTEGMHLKDLFFKAGNFTRDAYMELGHLRRIDPRTKESTIHTFDVRKAIQGDSLHNLRLTDQDEVKIHSIWDYQEKYTVSIRGLVRNPGEYPYAVNMMVNDLILLAGNVRDAAYMNEAELVRFSIEDGKAVETKITRFNIELAQQNHPEHNLKLEPMDVVTIKMIPDWWDEKRSVTVSGEVYFPGTYQIRKDERLSDIIARAGGYTEYAYLRGAVFSRESVKRIQQARLNEMINELELEMARITSEEVMESLSEEDLAAQTEYLKSQKILIRKLQEARATGRVVVDLEPLAQFKGRSTDMILENQDILYVPKQMNTVNVLGAVYNPTALIFDETRPELENYLSMTGGPTESADVDLMYVIRSDGTVVSKMSERSWWQKFENVRLYPGDTILIPEKVVRTSYMRDAKDITQILYQIATTAGVTAALF